jgi:hypothetical protein
MSLPAASRDLGEIGLGKGRRFEQHRRSDHCVFIKGEATDRVPRRRRLLGQHGAERRKGRRIDAVDQADENVIEELDVLLAEPCGAGKKQAGYPAQYLAAALQRAGGDDVIQFGNQFK